jgi:hypothetical protein
MKRRLLIKEGDVFQVDLGSAMENNYPEFKDILGNMAKNGKMRYFQYLMLDPGCLNSEVIRVFRHEEEKGGRENFQEIIDSGVDFYAHVVIKLGAQMKLWEKIGNLSIEKSFIPPLFRTCGDMPPPGPAPIFGKSYNWYIWQAGQSPEHYKLIGELTEKYKSLDDGVVESPISIIGRMITGEFIGDYFT